MGKYDDNDNQKLLATAKRIANKRSFQFCIASLVFIYILLFVRFEAPISDDEWSQNAKSSQNVSKTALTSSTSTSSKNDATIDTALTSSSSNSMDSPMTVSEASIAIKETIPKLLSDGKIDQATALIRRLLRLTSQPIMARSELDDQFASSSDKAVIRLYRQVIDGDDSYSLKGVKTAISDKFWQLKDKVSSIMLTTTDDDSTSQASIEAATSKIDLEAMTQAAKIKFPSETIQHGFIQRANQHLIGSKISCAGHVDCTTQDIVSAAKLCATMATCTAISCSTAEPFTCSLRSEPYQEIHYEAQVWNTFYEPEAYTKLLAAEKEFETKATPEEKAIRDYTKKVTLDAQSMQPGSKAAKGFNFNGKCGVDGYKCVVAYGLYGSNPKYVDGAIQNAKILKDQLTKPAAEHIFDGWIIRIYHDSSVPVEFLKKLKEEWNCELVLIDNLGGDIAGMFWRFLIADDQTVDRWVVRDSDSRLNPREWEAVKEWMSSGFSVHSIRDHQNHARPLNGGMWGGIKGCLLGMTQLVEGSHRNGYMADLSFLNDRVWPLIENDQVSHDSYSCKLFKNARPMPTQRPKDFQHVGQVFEDNKPRMGDINGYFEGNPNAPECRRKPDWIYG